MILALRYHLATNPDVQRELQAEIDTKVGKSKASTFEQCRDLKLLDAALKESIRLRQTVPMGMRVCPTEDLTIGGFPVPKGTCILPFTEGAHFDATYSRLSCCVVAASIGMWHWNL